MRTIVDISVPLKAGIVSDPPGLTPEIEFRNHADTARRGPVLLPRRRAGRSPRPGGLGRRARADHDAQRDAPRRALPLRLHDGRGQAGDHDRRGAAGVVHAPAVKLDFRGFADGYVATAADVEAELARIGHELPPLEIVVVNTSAGAKYGQDDYVRSGCGMGREATLYLLERGVRVTGTDAWSWDAPFVHTAERYAREHDASIIWEGHRAGARSATATSRSCTTSSRCPTTGSRSPASRSTSRAARRAGRGRSRSCREREPEAAALAGLGVDADLAAVALDQPLADRQARGRSRRASAPRAALEGAEDPLPVRRRDAGPVVLDGDAPGRRRRRLGRDRSRAGARGVGELHGVGDQVLQDDARRRRRRPGPWRPAGTSTATSAPRSRIGPARSASDLADRAGRGRRARASTRPAPGARVGEQPLRASRMSRCAALEDVPGVLALRVGGRSAALEQLGEAGDRPQGIGEVVRRDGGEAVELVVDGAQLLERVAERVSSDSPALGEVARDLREAGQPAVVVADRGDRHARPEAGAVLADPPALLLVAALADGDVELVVGMVAGPGPRRV